MIAHLCREHEAFGYDVNGVRGVEGEHEIVFVGGRVQMGVDTVIEINIDCF